MRIASTNLSPLAPVSSSEPRAAKSEDTAPAAPAASVVTLSSAGATAAASSVSAPSHGLTARLATIKTQLGNGEYAVDLDRLANRITDDDAIRGRSKTS